MGKIRIFSRDSEPFTGRVEAGGMLSRELKNYHGKDAVVLGIPRGGVVIGRELARELEAELDIVLSRKLGAPGNPELAIGAVSEDGRLFLHERLLTRGFAEGPYIEEEKARQLAEIARRIDMYRKVRPKARLKNRIVIVTDDGLATGATMQAALWAARQERPRKLIAAVPVAPEDTVARLKDDADEIIVLRTPEFFAAVGQFYRQFDQIDDEEVLHILKEEYNNRIDKR